MQDGIEPLRQVGPRRHLIGNTRVADLCLGADDALGHRGRSAEKGAGDLLGRKAAYLPQGQGHAGLRRQGGMAAREDQPQPVVRDPFVVLLGGGRRRGVEPFGELRQRGVEASPAAHGVDGFKAAGRNEPRPRIGRHTLARPLLQGRGEGIVQPLLGEVEVAEQADQRGQDVPRLGMVDGFHPLAQLFGRVLTHPGSRSRARCSRRIGFHPVLAAETGLKILLHSRIP